MSTTTRCSSSGSSTDLGRGLVAPGVEHHLRRGDPQLLAEEGDGERQQAVDEVQAGLLAAHDEQHAAERDVDDDDGLPGAQQPPEQGLLSTRYQHHAPHSAGRGDERDAQHADDEMDDRHRTIVPAEADRA